MNPTPSNAPPMPPAAILAGGKGTRLAPFTITFPKPLVPIGDMPILEILLRQLAAAGVRDAVLSLGHLAPLIRAYVGQRFPDGVGGMKIRFVEETEPTGTAGSLALIEGLGDTFFAMNGDLLTNIDFGALARFHRESGAELTIASHAKQVEIDLGVLEMDEGGRLVDYLEKPRKEYRVSMGIYVYQASALDLIPKGRYLDFPTLVQRMIAERRKVAVYPFDGLWMDIGRAEDYARAQEMFEADRTAFLPDARP